jgi:hypothetical protein
MDPISHRITPAETGRAHETPAKDDHKAEAPPAHAAEPRDGFVSGDSKDSALTREDRIKIALSKATLHVGDWIRAGTAGFIGETVGLAVGTVIAGGALATPIVAVIGAVGAVAGLLADHYHIPDKVGSKVHGVVSRATAPLRSAARHITNSFKSALGFAKKSGGSKGEEPAGVGGAFISDRALRGNLSNGDGAPSEKAMKSTILSKLVSGVTGGAKVLKAIPSFLYPSIRNATAAEKKLILDTLDGLPLKDVTSVGTITMSDSLATNLGASGMARNEIFRKAITFDRGELSIPGWGKDVIIHEVGHTRDFADGLLPLTGDSGIGPLGRGPWGKAPHITNYAATNHWEDFAESHVAFHENPESLKALSPEKFDAMQKIHEPTLYDKIMDRTGIREAGKKVSEAIDKVPYLRDTLQVAGAILGPVQSHHGATELQSGIRRDDPALRMAGKMDLAQGLAFTSKAAAPVGLGLLGLRMYLNNRIKAGKMSLEKAESIANGTLAVVGGPIGLTVFAAIKEMLRPDDPAGDARQGAPAGGARSQRESGPGETGQGALKKLTLEETNPETLFNPKEKFFKERSVAVDGVRRTDGDLTKDDKIFMAKVGTGAALGGILGTVAGWQGGALAGAALGGLVGGPFGAAVGAFVGKAAGILGASWFGAKLGAKLGRKI